MMKKISLQKKNTFLLVTVLLIAALVTALYMPMGNGKALSGSEEKINVTVKNDLTKTEVVAGLKALPHHGFDPTYKATYAKKNNMTPPYEPGVLSDETLGDALNTLKAERFLAGVSNEGIGFSAEKNKGAQVKSMLIIINNVFGHNQTKPSGMSEEMFSISSAAGECLAGGYTSPSDAIMGLVNEIHNVDTGHRMSLFRPSAPTNNKFGVGFSERATCVHPSSDYSYNDKSGIAEQRGNYLWPNSGYFPIEYISCGQDIYDWENPEYAAYWSAEIQDDAFWKNISNSSNISGTTNRTARRSESFAVKVNGKSVPVDQVEGIPSFKPKAVLKPGDAVTVTVALRSSIYDEAEDLYVNGTVANYTYTVKLFSLADELGDEFIDPSGSNKKDTDNTGGSDIPDGKTSIANASVSLPASVVYTGRKATPAFNVTIGGKTLRNGRDYTASFSDNTKVGKATVKLTGKGSYAGTAIRTFKILPQKATLYSVKIAKKRLTVKWKKLSGQATSYQIRYKAKGSKTWKTKKATSSKSSATIKKLTRGKQYQVQVRACKSVADTKYYGAWSRTATSNKVK